MHPAFIVLIAMLIFTFLVAALVLGIVRYQKKARTTTQRDITDRALLEMISEQIDGYLSAQQLAEHSGLTVGQARIRMQSFLYKGILKSSMSQSGRYYYELVHPIEEKEIPPLSEEPFLTVEDILTLLETYDYRLDYQNLIMATGLPLNILEREMKYFRQQKIVKQLNQYIRYGSHSYKFFLLEEPYRSDPDKFRRQQVKMNQQVKELLRNDQLI